MSAEHSPEKTIAQVIPAVSLPRDLTQFFSYLIPDDMQGKLRVGDVVRVPFRHRSVLGVVSALASQPDAAEKEGSFQLKEIEATVADLCLSPEQLGLARFISSYYFTPLSLVIKSMLPEITKRPARTALQLGPSLAMRTLPEEAAALVGNIRSSDRTLLLHGLGTNRHELYCRLIEQQDDESQTLLLMPEYFDLYSSAQLYIDRFGSEFVALLSSDLTKNQYYAEWQKARSGQARVVMGTRQAVFAPFHELGLVIVEQEHSSSYKQWDQNPRYHAVPAAIELARISGARIVLSSPTPSLESYYRTRTDFSLVDLTQPTPSRPRTIDLDAERKRGNFTFIAEELQEALLTRIHAQKQALIFIPRLGEKTIHQCKDCGYIAECPVCQSPLIGYRGKLYCSRCKQLHAVMASCPKCQGQNLSAFGGGSQRVFEELEELFRNKNIKIVQLDSSTSCEGRSNARIYADFLRGRIDILVGTQMVWKDWQMENLAVVAVIFPEILFSSPGFRSREKSWQFLKQLYTLSGQEGRTVFLETRKPEHKYLSELPRLSERAFLDQEIESRSLSLSPIPYPPRGRLVKLIFKHAQLGAAEREAKWQYDILQREIFDRHLRGRCEVMPPFPAQNLREYGKYRYHLILKLQGDLDLATRDSLLTAVKKDWIVDIDPDGIL